MIRIEKHVANHGDEGRVSAPEPGGDCIAGTVTGVVLLEVHEHIAFDVRIAAVEVEAVVTAAQEQVAQHLGDWSGPLRPAEVDDVAVAGGGPEHIAFEDEVAAGAMPAP